MFLYVFINLLVFIFTWRTIMVHLKWITDFFMLKFFKLPVLKHCFFSFDLKIGFVFILRISISFNIFSFMIPRINFKFSRYFVQYFCAFVLQFSVLENRIWKLGNWKGKIAQFIIHSSRPWVSFLNYSKSYRWGYCFYKLWLLREIVIVGIVLKDFLWWSWIFKK